VHSSLLRVDQKNNEDNRYKAKKSGSNESARVARSGEKTTYTAIPFRYLNFVQSSDNKQEGLAKRREMVHIY
jgi:hypothetical protein